MPPKGWRKDAQGNYPTTSYIKEQESVTIQDLLFIKSVITQLAKDVDHGDKKMMINKDAILALQRSATVFVNHLLMFAREIAKGQDRKSCNINDVLDALDQVGFGGFKTILSTKMVDYQRALELRKINRSRRPAHSEAAPNSNTAEQPEAESAEQDLATQPDATIQDDSEGEPNKSRRIDHS
ncbi:DPB4 (YDR121W) [Zygosaccharomyces parabailii]|uniref:DNA polymerase epsilon subunit D n=1 Tax=Zygosaccharomyces bailii (strain CLIB 213 / ATCC 58445 / CBS 680 / BCRC 21525 / NBRC 1098 / NCYC 1416 / NRRL Y-2227) TaxID=1333698 RepID=A0A8J2T8W1_ZYGB2|nr:DPB4 (YDR121W) [Zygosaccharomyces parabailii]CDF90517.1 ZYBA0S07-02850g1_1 [Zygosaccharomyces bailii CLIB 213]CDH15117.1 related to DNA polymerase epsilon subunit D [Zygosaccharomyces bailii ISA1307]SJM84089.1 related to DNA polymerase epsilon subunit D [Zygosaccharomyces bailii]